LKPRWPGGERASGTGSREGERDEDGLQGRVEVADVGISTANILIKTDMAWTPELDTFIISHFMSIMIIK
jgi:hypothetical protein